MAGSPQAEGPRPRVGHLGPAGTFSEEALLSSALPDSVEPVALETIYDTAMALIRGEVEWAVLPIENSLDGSVTVTLDLLADHAGEIEIVGERLLAVRHFLSACAAMPLTEIKTVLTHPQVPGQCRRFLRSELPQARVLAASSTAEAVRLAAAAGAQEGVAAIGPRLAAQIYGACVLREDVQDRDDNLTRFVWLGPRSSGEGARPDDDAGSSDEGARPDDGAAGRAPIAQAEGARRKTSLVFWGAGADRSGWLVLCLDQFAHRGINLTKIESRPRRERMGHYMFFVDLEGGAREPDVADAIAGLRELCEQVWVLGSYPAAAAL
jgi:prephenate dehydratase